MTDLSKHGLEPVAWLYNDDAQRLLRFVPYYEPAKDGLAETALYRADQVAEVVERLEAALRCLMPAQMAMAEIELADGDCPDDTVIFSHSGSGASDTVTAGMIRAALGRKKP